MTRLQQRLDALRSAGRKGLVPFITAGDPSLAATVPVMHALAQAGAAFDRALRTALDHRPVGHRVRERHAQLDRIGPRRDQRMHHRHRRLARGITGGDERDQRLAAFRGQRGEARGQARRHAAGIRYRGAGGGPGRAHSAIPSRVAMV